ncbi:MAG: allophanate hydrolase, partial [Pseudomonadota bacterium]
DRVARHRMRGARADEARGELFEIGLAHDERAGRAQARHGDGVALVVGKTNLDQFATGLVGTRTPHPVPRNAVDPALVPGGSSSGSAVAVAHGLVAFSLGTDTAGSGRVPAALNNIVGLKPSLGAISATGLVPACRTLDTISVFALTAEDAYDALRAAAAYDAADPYSRPVPLPPPGACPAGLRVGIPGAGSLPFFGDRVQEASFRASVAALAEAGLQVVELDFAPFHAIAEMLYEGAWVAERHAAVEEILTRSPEALYPVTRRIIAPSTGLSATDAFRGFYRLEALKRAVEPALAAVDLLCVPSVPTLCSLAEIETDPVGPNSRLGTYTNFVNLLGLSGLALPTAPRADGRPGSVTLLAGAGQDALLASIALGPMRRAGGALDPGRLGATAHVPPAPPAPATGPLPGEIEIAVCGAHMAGLPLNGELACRGGRFLRAVETAPLYRLYALPGGPPLRPGLVRFETGGAAIGVEVWALPAEAVGPFLAGIPSPLGLGTLQLADGTAPKGFLCEQAALAGAEDVTPFGCWRAVLAARAG